MLVRTAALLALALAACDAGPAAVDVAPKFLWTFAPDSYFSGRDFLDASAFSTDAVVLANVPPGGTAGSVGLTALDVQRGTVAWHQDRIGWLLHPPHATSPLYFAPYESAPGSALGAYTHVDRIDAHTGQTIARTPLQRQPTLDFELRMVWSARYLLVIDEAGLTAFDWTTGAPRWNVPLDSSAYLFPPLVLGDRLYVAGNPVRVLSIVDGSQLAAVPGECCTLIASPDGKHVFVRSAADASIELDEQLRVVRHTTGEVKAASNTYYATTTAGDGQPVHVYRYDRADPVFTLTAQDAKDYFGALALAGSTLYYFHHADATLSAHDLDTGATRLVDTVGSHFVISTDAVGTAGPYMGSPPIVEPPYLFTEEWGVHAYRIGN